MVDYSDLHLVFMIQLSTLEKPARHPQRRLIESSQFCVCYTSCKPAGMTYQSTVLTILSAVHQYFPEPF